MRCSPKHPKRLFAAETPLLRERFARELRLARGAADVPVFPATYEAWLRNRGIEPETGHVTTVGSAFFKICLEAKNASRT